MRTPFVRHLALGTFFVALAAIEVAHGVFRVNAIRARHRDEVVARVERDIVELASGLRTLLRGGLDHARCLATQPDVRALVASVSADGAAAARQRTEAALLPYLVAFDQIDGVKILDARGREIFRCERVGAGVGALPPALLATEPERTLAESLSNLPTRQVILSDLINDRSRVEVPPNDRQVLHYTTRIPWEDGDDGILVLTLYAAPLLDQVRRFQPIPGSISMLVDAGGAFLAHTDRTQEAGDVLSRGFSDSFGEPLLEIGEKAERPAGIFFSAPVRNGPPWRLVTFVPADAPALVPEHITMEYAWVVGSMLAIITAIAVAAVFFLRMSVRDVRRRERERQEELERQLQITERLGSLGLLTAGVAHEINNPLEGIGNYLALLERESTPAPDRARYLELIRHGFNRIRDIVRDLSTFARPAISPGTANLGHVLRHALKMVAYSRDFRHVEVTVEGLDDPITVRGDPGRLEQVFINLLHNAARAMEGEGRITVRAETLTRTRPSASEVAVHIDDEGPGISEEKLSRIFDPFFTTTDGTGLGLSISYGIVRAHGGSLDASNRPVRGARLTVRLPLLSGDERAPEDGSRADATAR